MATIRERKNDKGRVRYAAEVRIKGHPPVYETFKRKTDARRWAEQTESAIRERRYFKTSESLKRTLANMVDRYIANELPLRHSDQQKIEMHLTWWKKQLGHYVLADITPQMIAECRDKLVTEPYKRGDKWKKRQPATIKLYLASLSINFTFAVKEWGWLEANPVSRVTKPTVSNSRVRFLSDKERLDLEKQCQKSTNTYLYPVVMIALCTGMRWSEVTGLNWLEVDLKKRVVRLEVTKNKERRTVPITGPALEALKTLHRDRMVGSSFVFPRKDGKAPMQIRVLLTK